MQALGDKLIIFTNLSPVFKGASIALTALVVLFFAYWMKQRWQEPIRGGFLVFIGLAGFTFLYGLFILLFQPHWWTLPY
jgi:hypothetical protein